MNMEPFPDSSLLHHLLNVLDCSPIFFKLSARLIVLISLALRNMLCCRYSRYQWSSWCLHMSVLPVVQTRTLHKQEPDLLLIHCSSYYVTSICLIKKYVTQVKTAFETMILNISMRTGIGRIEC